MGLSLSASADQRGGNRGTGRSVRHAQKTLETLRLVRKRHPEMLLCVASNGLGVAPYAAELAAWR